MFYSFDSVENPRVDWQVVWKQAFNEEFVKVI